MSICSWASHTHLHGVVGEVEQPEAQDERGGRTVPRPRVIPAGNIHPFRARFYLDFWIFCHTAKDRTYLQSSFVSPSAYPMSDEKPTTMTCWPHAWVVGTYQWLFVAAKKHACDQKRLDLQVLTDIQMTIHPERMNGLRLPSGEAHLSLERPTHGCTFMSKWYVH
jgi:hypothetical protein